MPWTPSIPEPTHAPADDVENMQQNNDQIQSSFSVDHIQLCGTPNGQHKQIHFASNNVPSVPTSPPVLFTNTQDGLGNNLPNGVSELLFYSGTAAQGQNQYVFSSGGSGGFGSVLLPMGIILKWGSKFPAGATGSSITITFATAGVTAFPNSCFVAFATSFNNNRTWQTQSTSATQAVFVASSALVAGDTFFWFAIGN